MIDRNILYTTAFYKTKDSWGKEVPFYGSYNGMRYKIEHIKADEEAGIVESLRGWIFPEPKCFDETDDELKESKDFPFTNEGIDEACQWLNDSYESKADYWMSRPKW